MGMVSCGSSEGDCLSLRESPKTASLAGVGFDTAVSPKNAGKARKMVKTGISPPFLTHFAGFCYFGWGGAPMGVGFSLIEDIAPFPCRSRANSKSLPVDFTMENGTSAVTQVSDPYLSLRK